MLKSLLQKTIYSLKQVLRKPLVLNMLLVGGISLLVKLIGFYKETIVASYFGLSELLDTYYIAVLIPTFIQNVFIGALKNLFIPNYVTELKTTQQRGSFQSYTFIAITVLIISLTLSALVFTEFLLEYSFPGHNEKYYQLIRNQVYVALPCLFFWGYSGFLSGLLEIKDKFLKSSISQFFVPIVIILCLVFFRPQFGDMVLVAGLTLGSLVSFIYLLIVSIPEKTIEFGRIKINKNIKSMLNQYTPKVTSGLLTGINPFVDQFFAAQLVVGSISAIQYGTKIPAFTVGILILAIGNVLLPHFSKLITEDLERAYLQLFKILKIVFIGSLLISIFTIILSYDIVRILFERNEFDNDDTVIVSLIQKISLIYVPFYLCTLVCVNFLTAINRNKFMAWTSFWNLLLNIIMNIILVKYYAVYGLVWSTTIVYTISSFIYVGYTYKQFKRHLIQKI
tara:strand:- start:7584 stop:8936 length:1353 start_codon:yes stop_codon:yes gene_type:complete